MNIAQRYAARYESKDFINDYKASLFESYHNEKGDNINRIIEKFNITNYETESELSNHFIISREQAKQIFEFISENFDNFVKRMRNYYVGHTSIDSVSFGEQEEQISGIGMNQRYLRKVFDKAGYVINESNPDYAYYDLSSEGLHVDLLGDIELLNNFLPTIKTA